MNILYAPFYGRFDRKYSLGGMLKVTEKRNDESDKKFALRMCLNILESVMTYL